MEIDLTQGNQLVVDYLATNGIRALLGRRYNTRDILGQNWIIRQSTINIPMQPTEVNTRNLLDGSVSLHFENYQMQIRYSSQDHEIPNDDDEERTQRIAVLVE
ncbi:hypothetical protein ZIOFF_070167 [Zingiber officinale]|uniref:Uncharacterized protein n=1 Tax=Zingiber officinale TaxID=94328 RepID=A0A8J5C548_ZINOF|nr:hypothetical protein ZIOFF_070167 [Zingiber officinale]